MILNVNFLNSFAGTVLAACFMNIAVGNLISWSSPVAPKLLSNSTDNPFKEALPLGQVSWISSLITIGAVLGCWVFGFISDTLGRKTVFIILPVPYIIGYALVIFIYKFEVFCVARFLQGFSMGGGYIISLAFVGEICTKENRGAVLTMVGISSSFGSLFCCSVGPYVSVTVLNATQTIFPLAGLLLGILFSLESPYFYVMKNKEELAKKSINAYRGSKFDVDKCIEEMKAQIKEEKEGNILDIIKTKGYIKAFIIGNFLIIAQQFTGINGILMYSETIFNLTGSNLSPEICSIIIAGMNVIGGGMAPLVAHKFNRKTILLSSGFGMIIFETILGVYCILQDSGKDLNSFNFVPLICLTGFMLVYNLGCGPLCWVLAGELYPTRVKMQSVSFSISLYFMIGFFVAQYFNIVSKAIGIGALFLIFAGCCLIMCIFIKFFIIETRGITFEEIQNILNGKKCEN